MADWCSLIQQAFIARHMLDRHSYHAGPLSSCTEPECANDIIRLRSFLAGRSRPNRAALVAYRQGERYRLQRRFRKAMTPTASGPERWAAAKLASNLATEERDFLVRLRALGRGRDRAAGTCVGGNTDLWYEKLFLQYLRIKTAVFGLLVHRPGERGLNNFVDHFKQIKVYAPESALLRPAAHVEPGLRVHSVERRVAPDAWP